MSFESLRGHIASGHFNMDKARRVVKIEFPEVAEEDLLEGLAEDMYESFQDWMQGELERKVPKHEIQIVESKPPEVGKFYITRFFNEFEQSNSFEEWMKEHGYKRAW